MKAMNEKKRKILEKIVQRRNELGITQLYLSRKLNISNNGYFKVEKGITRLDVERLIEIAEILKVSPTYFFED